MRSKLLERNGGATYALVFATGDEVLSHIGNVTLDAGEAKVHAHAVLGLALIQL